MATIDLHILKAALEWHMDAGADMALAEEPKPMVGALGNWMSGKEGGESVNSTVLSIQSSNHPIIQPPEVPLGASEARAESVKLAQAAGTLEALRVAIAGFDGIGIKDTATNLVFSDGNPAAPVMLIGEAPGGDEDRLGKPFVGVSGQLLDKIMACAGLDRAAADVAQGLYISNILNWRPPGNRTPSPAEIEVSLPFIERHIQLVQPKVLIFCGGVAAKALMNSEDGVSKLRGKWFEYLPVTSEFRDGASPIPAMATYHPSYLLRTPAQKRAVWADMLMVLEKRKSLGLIQ